MSWYARSASDPDTFRIWMGHETGSLTARAIAEAEHAEAVFGDFASMHEAYGVLAEEVAELFEAVRTKQTGERCPGSPAWERSDRIRAEAIQVAAVALRIAEQAHRVTR